MTIYIDLFIIINFIADYTILSIANQKKGHNKIRKIIISFLACIYACFYIIFPHTIFYSSFFKLVFFAAMITAILLPCGKKEYFCGLLKGILSITLICGTVYSILYLTGNANISAFYKLPTSILLSCIAVSYIIHKAFIKISDKKLSLEGYTLSVTYNKKHIVLSCEPDTGNLLFDPVSDYPVIVADKTILNKLFGKDVRPINLCEVVKPEDFKTVPYHTISGSGIMFGFTPDKVMLNSKKLSKTILAFAPEKLSTDALINPLLIQEG